MIGDGDNKDYVASWSFLLPMFLLFSFSLSFPKSSLELSVDYK